MKKTIGKSKKLQAAIERAQQRRAGILVSSDYDWHNPTCDSVDDAILADAYLAAMDREKKKRKRKAVKP